MKINLRFVEVKVFGPMRWLLFYWCLSRRFLTADTPPAPHPPRARVWLLFCLQPQLPASQLAWLVLRPERRKEHPPSPKSRHKCQSNSTTCADIKHYCILTFHMCCNSAFSANTRKGAGESLFVFVLSEDSFATLRFHLSTRLGEICELDSSPRQWALKGRGIIKNFPYHISIFSIILDNFLTSEFTLWTADRCYRLYKTLTSQTHFFTTPESDTHWKSKHFTHWLNWIKHGDRIDLQLSALYSFFIPSPFTSPVKPTVLSQVMTWSAAITYNDLLCWPVTLGQRHLQHPSITST